MSLRRVVGAVVCHTTLHFHCKFEGFLMFFNCTKRRFAPVVALLFTSRFTKKLTKKSSKIGAESRQKPVLKTTSIFGSIFGPNRSQNQVKMEPSGAPWQLLEPPWQPLGAPLVALRSSRRVLRAPRWILGVTWGSSGAPSGAWDPLP